MTTKPKTPPMTPAERLSIRVSSMISHPVSQLRRMAVIHQLIDDPDDVWEAMVAGLREVEELSLTRNDDGTITLEWEPSEDQPVIDMSDMPEVVVERIGC